MKSETHCPECHHPIRFSDNEAGICEKIIGPSDRASLCGCLCVYPDDDSQPDQWRPIETAPTDGRSFLVASAAFGHIDRAFFMGRELVILGGSYQASHWMPLPDPPKQLTPPQ